MAKPKFKRIRTLPPELKDPAYDADREKFELERKAERDRLKNETKYGAPRGETRPPTGRPRGRRPKSAYAASNDSADFVKRAEVSRQEEKEAERVRGEIAKNTLELTYEIDYAPRPYQAAMEAALDSGKKRACLVWARRHGKDFACWNYLILKALETKGTYFYIFPEYSHGKKVIWQGITESGASYLEQIPRDLIHGKTETDMRLHLKNGSVIQVLGSAKPDALRGTNPIGVVLSEYAYQSPAIWTHILDPILTKNGGWAIFNSTPNGRNHFYDLCEYAKANPDRWFYSCVTNEDTGFVSAEEIARKKAQGMSEELLQQEYGCSFDCGVQGSYYGKLIQDAGKEGRIGSVPYDRNHLVYTAWDIGISDAMAIIFWQRRGNEILIIDHYENTGYALRHYAEHVKGLPYQYGKHFVPHDSRARSAQTGQTFVFAAAELGLSMTPIDNAVSILDGIERVRGALPRMYFDSVRCDYLLRCLQEYHSEYDDHARVFRNTPKHNWASHSADAMRILALSLAHTNSGASMSAEELAQLRRKAGVPLRRVGE